MTLLMILLRFLWCYDDIPTLLYYHDITTMLLWYYYDPTTILLWYYYDTTTILLRYYYGTTMVLLWYYYGTTMILLRYYYDITTILLWYYYDTTTALLWHCYCNNWGHGRFASAPWVTMRSAMPSVMRAQLASQQHRRLWMSAIGHSHRVRGRTCGMEWWWRPSPRPSSVCTQSMGHSVGHSVGHLMKHSMEHSMGDVDGRCPV